MAKFAIHEVDMSEQDKVPTDVDTLWCQRSCHNIGGIRMFVELKSSFQRAILCVYHVKIFFFAREKRDQNI